MKRKRQPTDPVNEARLTQRLEWQCKLIGDWASSKLKPLMREVEALRKEVAELRQAKHVGVWKEGQIYRKNNQVTHNGGMWLAMKNNKQRPGQSPAWKLIVKSGHAGNGHIGA